MKKLIIAFTILMIAASNTITSAHEGHRKKHHAAAPKYTCPMHPEVVRDQPGKCPKCGMKLVVKKVTKKLQRQKVN